MRIARRALLACAVPAPPALAQGWPTRPIRMIVPFVPGGSIGALVVAQAPADGYTLLYSTPGPLVTNPILIPAMPCDAARDFAPVSLLTQGAHGMAVGTDLPVRTRRRGSARCSPARAAGGAVSSSARGSGWNRRG